MSCGGCSAASHFPNPGDRDHQRGTAFNTHRREARRPTFFSNRLRYASALIQNPTTASFREFAAVLFLIFALYRGYFSGAEAHRLLARTDVALLCSGNTALSCLSRYIGLLVGIGWDWASEVVPWAFVAAVVVFFGEEGIRMIKGKVQDKR